MISDIKPGDHLCCIYSTEDEHRIVITQYLRAGLEHNEKVFYIVDARTKDVVINYLKNDGLDVENYLKTGQFAILTIADAYMKGGVFDPDKMIVLLTSETKKALAEGYSALRVTGEMSWALRGLPGSERLIEYENKLNTFFPGSKCLAICQYDRRSFDAEILLNILRTHPFAFIGANLYDNFYYTPPEDLLQPNQPELTLNRWIANIKDRKAAEQALRESEEKYRTLFSGMPSGVAVYEAVNNGEDFIFRDFNTAGEAIEHVRKEDVIGKRVTEVFPGVKEFGSFSAFQRVWRTGKPEFFPSAVYRDARDPGTWRESWIYKLPTGEVVAIYNDVTERKLGEMALQQANKQLSLLSSITRHDIKNQLMALKGYLELSHEEINNPTTLIEYIIKEEQAANTIEHQISFTKDYQELGVAAPEWQNVNASIEKAIAGLPMRAVHVEVDPKNPEVFADRLFEKVFYNLIDNALRYGGDQMKTIRISSQESDTSLMIICEDDGVGITAEDKKRLFTKGFGKNTGLGLFLSREILAITGITITENGVPGQGARFEITVPKGAYRMNTDTGNGHRGEP